MILWDGWEDKQWHSIYGCVSAQLNQSPIVLGLDDMSRNHGTANGYMESIKKCLKIMKLDNGKGIIALTTNNPSVMQAF
jgi:hypothetical protein